MGVITRELNQFETYLVHEFVEDYVDGSMSRCDMLHRVLPIDSIGPGWSL